VKRSPAPARTRLLLLLPVTTAIVVTGFALPGVDGMGHLAAFVAGSLTVWGMFGHVGEVAIVVAIVVGGLRVVSLELAGLPEKVPHGC